MVALAFPPHMEIVGEATDCKGCLCRSFTFCMPSKVAWPRASLIAELHQNAVCNSRWEQPSLPHSNLPEVSGTCYNVGHTSRP